MNSPPGIVNRRPTLVLITIFCLIETVWTWTCIVRGCRHPVDLITALFSLFLSFVAVSFAYRSSFRTDRIIFGTFAVVGALISVRAAPLSSTAMIAVDVAKSCMWSFSALVSLIILVRGLGNVAQGKAS